MCQGIFDILKASITFSLHEPRPAKTSTCVLDINHQNVTSKFGTRNELAFEDSFSIEWVSSLSKEFQVSSNESGQSILALGERARQTEVEFRHSDGDRCRDKDLGPELSA